MTWLAIAAGGTLGAAARLGVAALLPVATGAFPWATLWVNCAGSLVLGFVLVLLVVRFPPTRFVRPFIATGFLGAFTTYSTFAVETDLLVVRGRPLLATVYVVGTLVAGFAALWTGVKLAGLVAARAQRTPA